jgi:hypothetical protein
MSTLPVTDKEFGFAHHAAPDTSKEAAVSADIAEREQDVR